MALLTALDPAAAAVVAAALGYTVAPDVAVRLRSNAGLRCGPPDSGAVALTFDDGPHPEFTPAVLDSLAQAGARATFFVVGEQARAHPDLVRRVHAEGHLLGSHTVRHRHAYLLGPRATRREVEGGGAVIAKIVGAPCRWFRPPWGSCNAVTVVAAARSGQRVALWSTAAGDWWNWLTPEVIAARVLRQARSGAVVLLHDGGRQPGACAATARALPAILAGLARRNLAAVRLDALVTGVPGSPGR